MMTVLSRVCHATKRLDQHLWQPVPAAQIAPFLVHVQTAYPFRNLPINVDDPAIVCSFRYYNHAPQHAYIYHIQQRTVLEPVHGYVVRSARNIVPESMPYWYHIGYPSFAGHLVRRKRRPVQHERAVISLHEFGDDNYYHFYGDVLGKLALLHEHGIDADLPIVVSARLAAKPYFRAAVARSPQLRARRWIVQDQQVIDTDEVIVCKTLPHMRASFDWILDRLDVPPADPHAADRIFLTRSARRGRYIGNNDTMAQVCREHGFVLVDADGLRLDEQIRCFAQARYVIGIHGAGLTNLMFRRGAPCSVLELFPPDNLPPHYYWLAHNYGWGYDALVGRAGAAVGSFDIDVDLLRAKLLRLLAESSPATPPPDPVHAA